MLLPAGVAGTRRASMSTAGLGLTTTPVLLPLPRRPRLAARTRQVAGAAQLLLLLLFDRIAVHILPLAVLA